MAAGKTTFIHALCALLGVADTVSSPTYSLINEYHFVGNDNKDVTLYHTDWYRLKDTEEAIQAGIEDMLAQKNAYCFIEWAENAPSLLPFPHLWVTIAPLNDNERKIEVFIKNKQE